MKKLFLIPLLAMAGNFIPLCAQNIEKNVIDGKTYVFYPVKQKPVTDIRVDAVLFDPNRTVVTLYSTRGDAVARLLGTTQLVCHLKGGETKVLDMSEAQGISTTKEFRLLNEGSSFTVYFPAIPEDRVEKVKSVSFLEDPTGTMTGVFNVYDVRLNKNRMIIW